MLHLLLVLATAVAASAGARPTPIPGASRQLVVVTTPSWGATDGRLQRFARAGRGWQPVGAPVAVVVGRSGLGWGRGLHGAQPSGPAKAEGDGRAPAGVFRLTAAFGYAEAEPTGLPYLPSSPTSVCVDDGASPQYNRVFDADTLAAPADWASRERMRRDDGLYRLGVVVAHNGPGLAPERAPSVASAPVAGGGSCIFLHVWRGPGTTTSGCTAMPDAALAGVLAWLEADAEPVLVQLPRAEYRRLRRAWALP